MPSHTNLSFISELTSIVFQGGYGEYIYTKLSFYGSKIECVRTDNAFPPISQVCNVMFSLMFMGKQ